eukprot:2312168-Amphidinium_carterae.2
MSCNLFKLRRKLHTAWEFKYMRWIQSRRPPFPMHILLPAMVVLCVAGEGRLDERVFSIEVEDGMFDNCLNIAPSDMFYANSKASSSDCSCYVSCEDLGPQDHIEFKPYTIKSCGE